VQRVVELELRILTLGDWATVTTIAFDTVVHVPQVITSVYVYVPAVSPLGTV